MCARSGIVIDRDIRGKLGAPLSKIGTLAGKLILFNPFFKWSCKKPFNLKDISKLVDEMALTSQLGSDGSGVPRSTHSNANKQLTIITKMINRDLFLDIVSIKENLTL
tara:strand:- start:71 stop:394 length:324 start_codon:yes stop_codon:yes gene_type:complete